MRRIRLCNKRLIFYLLLIIIKKGEGGLRLYEFKIKFIISVRLLPLGHRPYQKCGGISLHAIIPTI